MTHPWILVVDSDERVTPELASEIRSTLEDPKAEAYDIKRLNHFLGRPIRHGGWERDRVTRLFRNHLRYEDREVHSEIVVDRPIYQAFHKSRHSE